MLAQDMAVIRDKAQGKDIPAQKAGAAECAKVSAHLVEHRLGIGRHVKPAGHRGRTLGRGRARQFRGDVSVQTHGIPVERLAGTDHLDAVMKLAVLQNLTHGGPPENDRLDHQQAR